MRCDHKFSYHGYMSVLEDFEFSAEVPALREGDPRVVLHIAKVGRGTVGQSYAGDWYYCVERPGQSFDQFMHGDELHSGTPRTHDYMARELAGFLAVAEDDRFQLFASED